MRVENAGVLSAPVNLDQYLNNLGYYGTLSSFVDRQGVVHFLVAGTKDGVPGLYYLHR
jgi:hypothetical protein